MSSSFSFLKSLIKNKSKTLKPEKSHKSIFTEKKYKRKPEKFFFEPHRANEIKVNKHKFLQNSQPLCSIIQIIRVDSNSVIHACITTTSSDNFNLLIHIPWNNKKTHLQHSRFRSKQNKWNYKNVLKFLN